MSNTGFLPQSFYLPLLSWMILTAAVHFYMKSSTAEIPFLTCFFPVLKTDWFQAKFAPNWETL